MCSCYIIYLCLFPGACWMFATIKHWNQHGTGSNVQPSIFNHPEDGMLLYHTVSSFNLDDHPNGGL